MPRVSNFSSVDMMTCFLQEEPGVFKGVANLAAFCLQAGDDWRVLKEFSSWLLLSFWHDAFLLGPVLTRVNVLASLQAVAFQWHSALVFEGAI